MQIITAIMKSYISVFIVMILSVCEGITRFALLMMQKDNSDPLLVIIKPHFSIIKFFFFSFSTGVFSGWGGVLAVNLLSFNLKQVIPVQARNTVVCLF